MMLLWRQHKRLSGSFKTTIDVVNNREMDMEKSEQINELATALSKAQSKFKSVNKGRTVKVKTKSGFEYSYKYAELSDIFDMVRVPMTENGLAIIQGSTVLDGKAIISTILLHSSGQFIKNDLTLPVVSNDNNPIQNIGSSITYGRRYEVSSILGISSEEDTDAASPTADKKGAKPELKPSTPKTTAPAGAGRFEK